MKIAKETWIILAIGLADLATTIIFIQNHGAQEANPIFKRYWEMGIAVFIVAKVALLVGPLSVLEWARVRRPRFTSVALRGAIAAYVLMYGVGFFRLNYEVQPEPRMTSLAMPGRHMRRHVAERMWREFQSARQAASSAQTSSADHEIMAY